MASLNLPQGLTKISFTKKVKEVKHIRADEFYMC